ncbi:hypothetical protein GcC1_07072 [Golovinomyces cichoracearum]|uniref:Uncharacterized protein n=1 Tax=Golovinomyces cichoracearum TaxID=62708 RepID=A0A420HV67_9PEZI|nr:hypothetical protein GcC1_07072 [Golovinomyces cichoracearum]
MLALPIILSVTSIIPCLLPTFSTELLSSMMVERVRVSARRTKRLLQEFTSPTEAKPISSACARD